MTNLYKTPVLILFTGLFLFSYAVSAYGQIEEPDVLKIPPGTSTLKGEYSSGFGVNVLMNNFGFGLGGEYRKVISTQSELTAQLRITGLRDVSEQTFTDFFFGQQIVPNKYQRAFAFPLLIGLRKRVFPNLIQENYRFFIGAAAGPVTALTYPYFEDRNENGYREQFTNNYESVNDVFTGLSEGSWSWGGTGQLQIGLDIGKNFANLSSIEFGYYFYYFPDGIQLMMPNQPVIENGEFVVDPNGELVMEPFFEPQKFFGTPQISFVFGWLW